MRWPCALAASLVAAGGRHLLAIVIAVAICPDGQLPRYRRASRAGSLQRGSSTLMPCAHATPHVTCSCLHIAASVGCRCYGLMLCLGLCHVPYAHTLPRAVRHATCHVLMHVPRAMCPCHAMCMCHGPKCVPCAHAMPCHVPMCSCNVLCHELMPCHVAGA